nr:class I SAM-dependent methyltransferase [Campylobacter sp.]
MKKKIIIFGASGYGLKVAYSLGFNCQIIAFADNNPHYKEKLWGGVKVILPSEINNYNFDFIVISVSVYDKQIREQLLNLNIPNKKIITFMPNKHLIWLDERYAMAKNCIAQIKERKISGNVAELGVYKGDFACFLNAQLNDRKIYLFDTFSGFDQNDLDTNEICGDENVFKDTSVSYVLSRMPFKNNIIIKKGYFPDTAKDLEDEFCFVSLDADLYKPIYFGLDYFYPRLAKGGYIFIHDFQSITYPGCKQAVYDWCDKNKNNFVPILDRCASCVITK